MRTRDARVVYLVLESATALLQAIVWTTAAVYFISHAHLGPLQLVLLGTAMELSILVFEIPTGIVADAVSRRRSVLIGTTLIGVAFVLTGLLPSFPALLGAQALLGLGYTFTSGATEAWIAGEVGDQAVGPLFLRAAQYASLAASLGIGLSVGLANLELWLPLVAGGLLQLVLAGWLAWAMPETGFRPVPRERRSTWRHLARTAGDGLGAARRSRVLLALLVVALFAGMSTEAIDRLWELHLLGEVGLPGLGQLSPVTWFGIIQLAGLGLAATVIGPARKRVDSSDPRVLSRLLFVLTIIEAATMVAFGLTSRFGLAVAALLVYGGVRSLREPLYGAWIVPMIQPPQVRATVLSTIGQADAVGQVLGGPSIGLVAALTSPGLAIVAAGNALAPVAIILGRLSTRTSQPQVGGEQPPTAAVDPGEEPHLYRATSSYRLPLVATHAHGVNDRQIRRLVLDVDLVGSRRIWPSHVGGRAERLTRVIGTIRRPAIKVERPWRQGTDLTV